MGRRQSSLTFAELCGERICNFSPYVAHFMSDGRIRYKTKPVQGEGLARVLFTTD